MLATEVRAAILTFEGQSNTTYSSAITRDGFDIGNVATDTQHFHEISADPYGLPSNGTGVLLNDRNTRIFILKNGGGAFSLGALEVGTALNNLPAVGLMVEGFLSGISEGILNLANLGAGLTTLNGGSLFANIDRVVFDGICGGGGFVLDNVNLGAANPVSAVPLPAGLPLMLSFLGVFGFVRSRRKA